jgi:mono/diheme cytochrome c family protein
MAKECMQKKLRDWGFILPNTPKAVKYGIWLVLSFALIPIAVVYHARMNKSEQPRIHLIQDMDNQEGYRTQASSPIFADGRAARQPILTTVAYGHLEEDDHYYRGYELSYNALTKQSEAKFFSGMPALVNVDKALLERGQQRFNIYCAPCHGYDAHGNGSVNIRANTIGATQTGWLAPLDLTTAQTRGYEDGKIYNVIRNGKGQMPAMGSQVPVQDRWAIVAYVRALQISQAGTQAAAAPSAKPDSK